MRRHGHGRLSRLQTGMLALLVLAVATYFAFARDIPFTKPYEVKAMFDNTSTLGLNSPVRIAGVNVGKVAKVEPAGDDSTMSVVTLKIEKKGLPIHDDAELKVRPRIFFGGNYFVDVRPGTPGGDELDSGDTIPATQTSAPVGLDEVLSGLRSDTRKDLQKLLDGYGEAISGQPKPGEDDDQDPETKGEIAAKSLNDSLEDAPEALRTTAIVNQALLGTERRDVSKLIAGGQKVAAALASRETQLKDLISNFNTTTGALASEQANLRRTIRLLPEVLDAANPAFDNLNASFPPTRAWAREIIPGVRETAATIESSFPWIAQTRELLSPPELQGLVRDLQPATRDITRVNSQLLQLPAPAAGGQPLPAQHAAADGPRGDPGREPHDRDRELQGAVPVLRRALRRVAELRRQRHIHALPDRRRQPDRLHRQHPGPRRSAVRQRLPNTVRHPPGTPRAQAAVQPDGPLPRPGRARPERRPHRRRTVKRAISKHLRDFLAILFMIVVAAGVAGYILSNQRFYLPAWVPVVGTDFYEISAELETAQAVVPGQGQTVNVAGVKVGEIGTVELEDGVAVVDMKIKRKYAPVYKDATILLRPKTPLKDMFLELDPGNPKAGEIKEGGRVRSGNTLPDVNIDEFLAALDTDTMAYLRILLSSGAEAFERDAPAQLRETLKRFEPTARDARKVNAQLSKRRTNIRRVIHNFQELSTELGSKDRQLAAFIDSANANFEAIANQERSLRESVRLLPDTLAQTRDTLGTVSQAAADLGPAFQKLRPGARALAPTLRQVRPFNRETTPIIRNELRPFARDSRQAVRDTKEAAEDLVVATPRLTRTVGVINSIFNTLAYNPRGSEEGYLFWSAWLAHAGATLWGTQDAHGPVRRGLVFIGCRALTNVLPAAQRRRPALDLRIQLLNPPKPEQVCPGSGG